MAVVQIDLAHYANVAVPGPASALGDGGAARMPVDPRDHVVDAGELAVADSLDDVSDFDVFLADCPARTTLEVIGHTWSVVAIVALGERPMRHGELLERIGGISKKMLNQTLRRLHAHGLVVHADERYALTDLGSSLLIPVRALAAWAETHTVDLLGAHDRAAREPTGSLAARNIDP